jgi:hypothetical protein
MAPYSRRPLLISVRSLRSISVRIATLPLVGPLARCHSSSATKNKHHRATRHRRSFEGLPLSKLMGRRADGGAVLIESRRPPWDWKCLGVGQILRVFIVDSI